MAAALVIARRELAAYFYAPIGYVVGVLFLVVQGLSFWAVVTVLADPRQQAPLGAVLSRHFGGTFLYWSVLLLVVSVIAMRLIAEERRQGSWETLLTAPVTDGAVLLGKWAGAVTFYALLWMPTVLYLLVLRYYAPPGASFELGPVIGAYAGVLLMGAGFLALGLAASAVTASQIIAAVISFMLLLVLLLVGELDEIGDFSGPLAAISAALDLRAHAYEFARGAIDLHAVVLFVAMIAAGLAAASAVIAAGRRSAQVVQRRAIAAVLIVIIGVCATILARRYSHTLDLSSSRANSLEPATLAVLDRVDRPIKVLAIRPSLEEFDEVYREIDRLLSRMERAQPLLALGSLDPVLEGERIAALAGEYAVSVEQLREGGAVVLQAGGRTRVLDLLDMARFRPDDLGAGGLARFEAEDALADALAELVVDDAGAVCFTSGHGEVALASDDSQGWSSVLARLQREGLRATDLGSVVDAVPAHCRALIVAGPRRPLPAAAAAAIATYVAGGGRLLVAYGQPNQEAMTLPATGLELVLAEVGIKTPAAIVIDPARSIAVEGAWATADTYAPDHPITSGFQRRRLTVWQRPRAVLALGPAATALVTSSATGWGETDLTTAFAGDPAAGPGDVLGPVSVAVATETAAGARVVVVGDAGVASEALAGGAAGDVLITAAIAWLTGLSRDVEVGAKTPEQLRLVMTKDQLGLTCLACVVVIPSGFAALGMLVWWRRRRES